MALPRNPAAPEFYVYRLETQGMPFYVGIGRDRRASDRVRYIRYLLTREAQGKPVRWNLSAAVVAHLLKVGNDVSVSYPVTGLVRSAALKQERLEIARLVADGAVLANYHHNPRRPSSAEDVVRHLLEKLTKGHT